MENKVKIDVKVLHYTSDIEPLCICDIEPLYIDEKIFNGRIFSLSVINDYCSAIDNYCRELAKNTIPYDADYEDYFIQFWHNGELISSAMLSNYSDFFGQNIDDAEIAE